MNTWLKVATCAVAGLLMFGVGYKYAAALYEADIAEMQVQHTLALKEKTDEYRSKEQSQAKELAAAWDQLERARAESVSLRDDVDRVRASSPTVIAPSCPEPIPIPAHLSESDLPAAQIYSQKVQDYLQRVQSFLKDSQESTMR